VLQQNRMHLLKVKVVVKLISANFCDKIDSCQKCSIVWSTAHIL